MGKLTFKIVLDNPQNVYFAGQCIKGHVTVNTSEPLITQGITLTMLGAANVHWSEEKTTGTGEERKTTTIHYKSYESYFNNQVLLYDTGMSHPAGHFNYPFQKQLPQDLPSSFEGEHGNIRYYMKCTIDRPLTYAHYTEAVFTVIANLDLNKLGAIMRPLRGGDSKTLCCCCCASGPIEASVSVDRGGFVPGENILINAVIDNGSNRSISSTKAKLFMETSYYAESNSISTSTILAGLKTRGIGEGRTMKWQNERLHIPPVPPSKLEGCRIIDIKYYINFIVAPSGPAIDLMIQLPITIGTIPLREHFEDLNAAAAAAGYTLPVSSYVPPAAPVPPPAEPDPSPTEPVPPKAAPVHPPPPAKGDPAYPPPTAPGPAFPAPSAPGPAFPAPSAPGPAFPAPAAPGPAFPAPSAPGPAFPAPAAPGPAFPAPGPAPPGYSAPGMPPSAPLLPPGAPPDAPPPSYQECVFGRVDTREEEENEHTMGNKSFAPSYAYYNWNNTVYPLPEQSRVVGTRGDRGDMSPQKRKGHKKRSNSM